MRWLLCSHQFCTFMWTASMAEHAGAARRRQRRLRQWLRHERLSVAMALAETNHHAAPRGQTKARVGGEARVALHGHDPEASLPQGSRPPCLGVPRGPHVRVQRRTVQQVVDAVPLVPLLDDRRKWWTQCWSSSVLLTCRLVSRSSQCPRSPLTVSRSVWWSGVSLSW